MRTKPIVILSLILTILASATPLFAVDQLHSLSLAPASGMVNGLTTGPMGPGNSIQGTLEYQLEATKGKIGLYTAGVAGNLPHTGVEIPIFVNKGKGKVQTRFSVKCEKNSPEVTPIVNLRYVLFEVDAGGAIIQTLVEKFQRVDYKFLCKAEPQAKLPDLTITDILLDKNCQVVVKVKNLGPGSVPDEVWTVHKPESSSVYLYIEGAGWGGATIWKFDPGKALQSPGGEATYTSTLKVSGTKTIKATVDHTKQVTEANEGNNERKEKLTCQSLIKQNVKTVPQTTPSVK